MSIMPRTGVCFNCGHDWGNGMGSPDTLRILSATASETEALKARITELEAALAAQPAAPKEWQGPWQLQIDSYMTGREGVHANIIGKEVKIEYTNGADRWTLALPVPTDRDKKLNLPAAPAGEPVANLTCKGKDSAYIEIGVAAGEGTSCGSLVHVYRDAATGNLLYRTPMDFSALMERIASPVANAGQKVASSGWKVASEHATLDGQAYNEDVVGDFQAEARQQKFDEFVASAGRAQAVAVPDGWRLVPVEPTDDMRCACVHGQYADKIDEDWAAMLAAAPLPQQVAQTEAGNPASKFQIGDHVRKVKGSQWSGKVVGTYSTSLTPEGYAVESSTEHGSVQIYPAAALELAPASFCDGGQPFVQYQPPAPLEWPCAVCDGTGTAFGKRCICAGGQS